MRHAKVDFFQPYQYLNVFFSISLQITCNILKDILKIHETDII